MRNGLLSTFLVASLAVVMLAAAGCGAYNPGGGGGTGTSVPGQAQGFYSCTLQSGPTMQALILPDDTFFGMFGSLTSNSFSVTGMATGKGASGNLTYAGTFTEFVSTGVSFTDVLAATDLPQSSMSGSITENGTKTGFGGAALPASSYDYTTQASQSAITGSWVGSLLDGTAVTLNITSGGGVASPAGSGCSISQGSTIVADTKNDFYNVSLIFGPSPCPAALAGATATGKGVFYLLPDGATHELILAATVGTVGTAFFSHQ